MKHIIIIGCGFAGLTSVRTLRKQSKSLKITLIAPKAELVYLPSLIWIPSAKVSAQDICVPLEKFFKRYQVNYIKDRVVGVESERTVCTEKGVRIDSDALIIASGGCFIKELPGIEHAITPCENISATEEIKEKLAKMAGGTIAFGFSSNPNEPSAMRGGPIFEFLFTIDTQLRKEKRRAQFELIFFSPAPKPGIRLGENAVGKLLLEMKKRGIKTHLGHKLKSFSAHKIISEGGEFDADLILFMPGMTGNKWLDNTPFKRSKGGLLAADKFCQVIGAKMVFVAGDAGSFPGPEWQPKQAHMADLQAVAAAKNALLNLANKTAQHTFQSELICIVDSLDKGMLVKRSADSALILPPLRLFHYVKRIFAWWYLRQYR